MVARRERNDQRYYKQVRLYLGDVEEIERALNQVTGQDAGRFDFSNGTWEAENVAELATKGEGPFSEFEMKRYSPGLLSFTTHGSTARLYVSDADDLQLRGAYERIDSILTGAQRPLLVRWLYSMTAWCVLCLVTAAAGISAITIAARTLRGDGPPGWIGLLSLAAFTFALIAGWNHYRTTVYKNGLVYMVPKSSRPTFFQRKRDDLVMLVIGGVIGAMFTVLIQLLL